jgi:hypothetical protein
LVRKISLALAVSTHKFAVWLVEFGSPLVAEKSLE